MTSLVERPRAFARKLCMLVAVSAGPVSALRLVAVLCWLWLKKRTGRRGGRLHAVAVRDEARVVSCLVGEYTDLEVLREVFAEKIYALPTVVAPRVIVDLGSNFGASVLFFRARFPGAAIHAYEPDRFALRRLRANIACQQRVTVHPVAVAAEDGERDFHEADLGWGSSLFGCHTNDRTWTRVRTVSLDTVMREHVGRDRVDVLKIDVEGAEWEILAGNRLADIADVVVGEIHVGVGEQLGWPTESWRPGLDGFDVSFVVRDGDGPFVAIREDWVGSRK